MKLFFMMKKIVKHNAYFRHFEQGENFKEYYDKIFELIYGK